MSGFQSAFKLFPYFDQMPLSELMAWAPVDTSEEALDNYFANRLLYPQVCAVNQKYYLWDQILLKAAIARQKDFFYNSQTKRLHIPAELQDLVPDLIQLVELFLDVCQPQGINYVWLKPDGVIGTILTPKLLRAKGSIVIVAGEQRYEIVIGTLGRLAIEDRKIDIHFTSVAATLMGQPDFQLEVAGGQLGILIDTRLP